MKLLRTIKRIGGGVNPSLAIDLTRFRSVYESERINKTSAFTLAEMMVVMLILSVILAAMAPVMTTRYKSKPNDSSPWKYEANNRLNAYFGGPNSIAMIGQNEFKSTDNKGKLLIRLDNADADYSLLAFKRGDRQLGRLYMNDDGGMMFGSTTGFLGANANSVGRMSEASGTNATAFGSAAKANKVAATAVGSSVTASGVSSLAVGTSSNATADNSIAIGNAANGSGASAVAIGQSLTGSGASSVTIGQSSTGSGASSIAIGNTATGSGTSSIAVGQETTSSNYGAIAMGLYASANGSSSVAIATGNDDIPTAANFADDVVIGSSSSTQQTTDSSSSGSSIAIGGEATAYDAASIAIGPRSVSRADSVAIGRGATIGAYESIAIGLNAKAGETTATTTSSNSIAIGGSSDATGGLSIAIGSSTHATNTYSIAIGGLAKAVGYRDIAIGENAGRYGSNGSNNIYIGQSASPVKNSNNVSNSVMIGYSARVSVPNGVTTNNGAVAIGYNSKAGSNGVAIGYKACNNATGANKVCIGANSGPAADTKEATSNDEMIFLGSEPKWKTTAPQAGDWARSAVMVIHNVEPVQYEHENRKGNPYGPTVYINGNLVVRGYISGIGRGDDRKEGEPFGILGNKNGELDGAQVKWYGHDKVATPYWSYYSRYSDRRLKYVGKENKSGLDKIRQLKVFNYTFKKDTTKTPHVGVIAQDLQKVFPNAVKKGADGFLTIRMEDMFYAVINAIKELDAKYQAQEKRINELEKRIEKLEAKVK